MDKRIKILFTIPNFDTAGSGRVVYDLVKGLDKDLFKPEICCFHRRGDFYKTIEALGVKIHVFPFATSYRPYWSLPVRVLKIVRFFKRHRFDLIHSWHWSSDITEPLAAKLAGIPFVYTKKAMGWGNKAWLWRSKLSTKIIAINSDMKPQFFSTMENKVVEIPLGVDTDYYKPQKTSPVLRMQLGIDDKDFVIVTVANLVPVKGAEILIEAVNSIKDDKMKLLIVGDDSSDYAKGLKRRYTRAKVQFLGKQTDVRPYLSLADVFVIPTLDEGRKEGLPIAPLEAMASGTIVIGSNISGINDILEPFKTCLFEPNNIHQLITAILGIKSMDVEDRNNLTKEMREHVMQSYLMVNCIENHQLLYKNLAK